MENFGVYNSAHGADRFGFRNLKRLFWNLEAPALYEHALANREAQLIRGGALAAGVGRQAEGPAQLLDRRDDDGGHALLLALL